MNDAELAAALARGAGAILLEVRSSGIFKGEALGAAGDETAHRFIAAALREHRPDDGFLSEECADTAERLSKERVWIIDPLDGTREYSEGRDDWAVHVALAIHGCASIGAVALPSRGKVFSSGSPPPVPAPTGGRPRMVVSRTRPPSQAERVVRLLGAEIVPMGSCGAKAMAVVAGDADIYLHAGGMHEWDSCAPAAVAAASGLHCSRIDGNALTYNRANPYLPDLLICRRDLSAEIMAACS